MMRFLKNLDTGGWVLVVLMVFMGLSTIVQVYSEFKPIPDKFTAASPQKVTPRETVPGGVITITSAGKCNNTNEKIAVSNISYWHRISGGNLIIPRPESQGATIFEPGCRAPIDYQHTLPKDMSLGTWHLEGINIVIGSDPQEVETYYSETFEVVAK